MALIFECCGNMEEAQCHDNEKDSHDVTALFLCGYMRKGDIPTILLAISS
jgi:hypothetical protein